MKANHWIEERTMYNLRRTHDYEIAKLGSYHGV